MPSLRGFGVETSTVLHVQASTSHLYLEMNVNFGGRVARDKISIQKKSRSCQAGVNVLIMGKKLQ